MRAGCIHMHGLHYVAKPEFSHLQRMHRPAMASRGDPRLRL